jgi:transposase-like protein
VVATSYLLGVSTRRVEKLAETRHRAIDARAHQMSRQARLLLTLCNPSLSRQRKYPPI